MIPAGADTTVSALTSFILAMLQEPEVQKHAQEEIDRVCVGRLPDFNDRASLPFIQCIVWESLRWNPVTPMGVSTSCLAFPVAHV
jgi:cytochrome P450